MAIVHEKRKRDKSNMIVQVDKSHENYIKVNCSDYGYHEMHVYFFDSMSTRIREFRTAKSVEFFPNAEYILDPSIIPIRGKEDEKVSADGSASTTIKVPVSTNQNDKRAML